MSLIPISTSTYVNTISTSTVLTLPPASTVSTTTIYYVQDATGNAAASTIYIYTSGSDTIENQTLAFLNVNFASLFLASDSISNWMILQYYPSQYAVSITYVPGNTFITASVSANISAPSFTYTFYQNTTATTVGATVFQTIVSSATSVNTTNTLQQGYYYYFTFTTVKSSFVQANLILAAPTNPSITSYQGQTQTFTMTAADQFFTVPTSVTSLTVYLWGSGGGSTIPPTSAGPQGGAGAFLSGTLTVTPNETLTIVVGQAGCSYAVSTGTRYGGGGAPGGHPDAGYSSSGGGRSAIRRGTTDIVTVGSGGGGRGGIGGAGGIVTGGAGTGTATGGTQTDGGAGANAGGLYTGGNAGQDNSAGGGSGYYGGGGGGQDCNGGGGSSLYSNLINYTGIVSSDGFTAPNQTSPYYITGVGNGGTNPGGGTGGNGLVVITYGANSIASWAAVSGASSYILLYYQSPTFTNSAGNLFQVFTGLTGTSQGATNTPTNGYYYYAIILAVNSVGYYSPSKVTVPIQISTTLPAPTGLPGVPASASITLTSSSITATWAAVVSATSYIVIFYQNNLIFQVFTGVSGTTQATTLPLTSGSSYYAVITSVNTNGYSSTSITTSTLIDSYSNSIQTAITGYPGNPNLSFIYPNTLICTWTGATGTYTVSFYGGSTLLKTFTTTTTSQTFAAPITINTLYYATITNGIYSVQTNTIQPTLYPYIPANATLSFTYPTLTLRWSASQQTLSYSVTFYQANQQVQSFTNLQTTSISYTPTTTGSFYASVQAVNSYGYTSVTTASVQVTMTPVTTITLNITSTSLLASYTSTNASSYSITFYYNANNNTTQGTAFNTVKTTSQTVTVPLYSATIPYYYYAIITSTNSYGSSAVTSQIVNYTLPAPTVTITSEGTGNNKLYFTWSSTYTNSWTFVVEIQEGALQIPFTTINGTGSTGGGTVVTGSPVVFIATATLTGPGGTTRTFFTGNTGITSSTPSYIVVPPSIVPSATISLSGLYALASWTPVATATSYTISFYQGNTLFQTVTNVIASSQLSTALVNGYTYSASIISVNSYAFSSAFTTLVTAIIQNPPTAPTTATLTISGLYVFCTWSGAVNATSYTVRFYQNTVSQASGGVLLETGTTQTLSQISTTPLTLGYYYYGTVTSVNAYGSSAPFATAVIITNQSPPQPPATLTLTLSGFYVKAAWALTTYAASYTVTFYQNATATTVGGTAVETDTLSGLTQTSTTPLLNGYYYYAAVTAANQYGTSAATLTPITTLIIANKPMPSAVVTISFSASSLISTWAPATNAVTYTVTFYQSATQTTSGGTLFETDTGITILNITPVTIPLNGFYYYSTVQAINTFGTSALTTSSTAALVNGLLPSTIPAVIMSFAGSQVTASWSASVNAATYTIVFYQTLTQVITDGLTFESDSSVTPTQTTSTPLLNSYYYYAIVTPINRFGYGAATTSVTPVQAQVLPFIPTNATISFAGTQVTVSWSASSYSTSYSVKIYQRATAGLTGGSLLETDTASSTSQISLTNLVFRNYYYATVTGVNQYGSSSAVTTSNSAQAGFTPLVPTNASISLTTFQAAVNWTAASYTNTYTVRFYQVATPQSIGGSLFETGTTASTSLTCRNVLLNGYYYYASITSVNEFASSSPVITDVTAQIANVPTNPVSVSLTISGSSIIASWTASTNADSYTVIFYQVATAVTTGGTLLEIDTATTVSQSTTSTLLNGKYYYATVQAVNAFGSSSVITSATPLLVTTILPLPPSNVAISFAGTQVTATWDASPANATSYTVIFYQNNNPVITGGITFETDTSYVTSQSSSTVLLNDYYYYATVQGVNSNGSSSPITSASTTAQITGILPTLPTSVAISFAGTQLTASWVPSAKNAGTYTVIFYQVPTRVTTGGSMIETYTNISVNTQQSSTILVNGFYYYATVTAINTYGSTTSVVSATAILITTILPTAPSNVAVSFAGTQVTATWTASAKNATSYTILFYQVASSQTTGGTLFETVTGNTGTTQLTSIVLLNGYYYYATVAGINVNGSSAVVASAAATVQITTILPTPPISPTIAFSPNYMTVSWTASAKNATSYTVVFYQNTTSALTGGILFETDSGISGTSQVTLTALVYNQYYYAVVSGVNTNGSSTGITTSTAVVAAFAPLAPTNVTVNFSGTQVTASWTASSYTSTYTIIFYEVASPLTTGGTVFETDTGQAATSQLTSTVLLNNKYYYATVQSINQYSSSAIITSSSSTIQVTGIYPTNPTNVSITLSGNQASVSWTASAKNATSYTVVIYNPATNTTTGGTILETDTGLTGTTLLSTNTLTSGQYYYATVTGVNSYGSSSAITSSSAMLASILPTGGAITLNSLTATSGSITITPASLATGYTVYISTTTSPADSVYSFTTTTTGSAVAFTPSSLLAYNISYYAVMIPYNIYGNSSSSSYSSSITLIPLYTYSGTLTFTPAGATGQYGPTLSQAVSAYSSFGSWVSNTSYFNMTTQGNQLWTVPQTKNYTFNAAGAGTNSAVLTATFLLQQGHKINIVVGQLSNSGSNGNGGTFIYNTTTSTLLMACGGSGGGSGSASLTTSGNSASSGGAGGTNGGAGNPGVSYFPVLTFAGGCGPNDSRCSGYPAEHTTYNCTNLGGGSGGGYSMPYASNYSTFGGGGGGGAFTANGACYYYIYSAGCQLTSINNVTFNGSAGGGGGGGYSGGGGGSGYNNNFGGYPGGGGGSYCSTTPTSSSLSGSGSGYVSIT